MPSKGNKAKHIALNNTVMPSEGAPSRFDIAVNQVKKGDEVRNVAVIDIEGAIGFDFMKWIEGEEQNDSETIMNKIKQIEELDVAEIKVNLIKSPGGLIEDGIAIHDALAMHKAPVTVEVIGFAASIASVILQAGNTRRISANARVLPHHAMIMPYEPFNVFEIDSMKESLMAQDERIDDIYAKRGVSKERKEIMDKNNGNGDWINAKNAKRMGFVDEVFEPYTAIAKAPSTTSASYAKMFRLPEFTNEDVNERELVQEQTEPKEVKMTKEEMLAALAENNTALALALAGMLNKAPQTPEPKTVEVAFDGDVTNMEDIDNHKKKLEIAQLKAATDFNNIDSVIKFQNAVKKINGVESNSTSPKFNTNTTQEVIKLDGSDVQKGKNLADTRDAIAKINAKQGGK